MIPSVFHRFTVRVAACFAAMTSAGGALAQDAALARELSGMHVRVVRPALPVSVRDAEVVLERLEQLAPDPSKLAPAERVRAMEIEIWAALATGNAGRALERYDELRSLAPQAAGTRSAGYAVGVAGGRAALVAEAAESHKDRGPRLWAVADKIGQAAPQGAIRSDSGGEISLRQRENAVLLLDFWSMRQPPDRQRIEALRALHSEFEKEPFFEMVGVNADTRADFEKARKFARDSNYVWKQCFEQASGKASITHGLFKSEQEGPTGILIDSRGRVRAAGEITDPALVYAVRAAVAEARGDFPYLPPRSLVAGTAADAETAGGGQDRSEPQATGDLPSNPDAAAKLRQAHAFRRAGRKTDARRLYQEIVRDYPGSREAAEAQEMLEAMGGR